MTSELSEILISIKTFSGKGTDTMRLGLQKIGGVFAIKNASGVYKVDRAAESLASLRDIKKEERLDGLAMVVRAQTNFSPAQVLTHLEEIEFKLQKEFLKRTLSFNLLVYDQKVVMQPNLSVPHPEMHLRPEEIIPAVEVWPNYLHPVLKKSLLQLSRNFANVFWGEFITQGSGLLNFSNSKNKS